MKKQFALIVSLITAALLALTACGSPLPPASTGGMPVASSGGGAVKVSAGAQKYASLKGEADKGNKIFHGTCNACHGDDAKGKVGLGKNLVVSPYLKGISDADFVLFVTKGRPASDPANTTKVDMPAKGGNPALSDQDLADVVAYVRSLQRAAK
ncbi:MAG: c-type cytochrome [Chloroflexi bacterium]|nr:c-type cytochrome [Chloroflexota bacterium]